MDIGNYAKIEGAKRVLIEIMEKVGMPVEDLSESDLELMMMYSINLKAKAKALPEHKRLDYLIAVATTNAVKVILAERELA